MIIIITIVDVFSKAIPIASDSRTIVFTYQISKLSREIIFMNPIYTFEDLKLKRFLPLIFLKAKGLPGNSNFVGP